MPAPAVLARQAARRMHPEALRLLAPRLTPAAAAAARAALPPPGPPDESGWTTVAAHAALLPALDAADAAACAAALLTVIAATLQTAAADPHASAWATVPDLAPWETLPGILAHLRGADLLRAADLIPALCNDRRLPPPPMLAGAPPWSAPRAAALRALATALDRHACPDALAAAPRLLRDPHDAAVAAAACAPPLPDPLALLDDMARALAATPDAVVRMQALAAPALSPAHGPALARDAWRRWRALDDAAPADGPADAAAVAVAPTVIAALTIVDPAAAASAVAQIVAALRRRPPHPAHAALLLRLAATTADARAPVRDAWDAATAWARPAESPGGRALRLALRIAAAVQGLAPPPADPVDPPLLALLPGVWRRAALPGAPVWPGLPAAMDAALAAGDAASRAAVAALLPFLDAAAAAPVIDAVLSDPDADDDLLLAALRLPPPDDPRAARLTAALRTDAARLLAAARAGVRRAPPRRPTRPLPVPALVPTVAVAATVVGVAWRAPFPWRVQTADGRLHDLPAAPFAIAGVPPRPGVRVAFRAAAASDGALVGVTDVRWSAPDGRVTLRSADPADPVAVGVDPDGVPRAVFADGASARPGARRTGGIGDVPAPHAPYHVPLPVHPPDPATCAAVLRAVAAASGGDSLP